VPGIPDIYQGCELWDFSLVDPDNRRPVDFVSRRDLLDEMGEASVGSRIENWGDGREKMFVTARLLALRRQQPELFASGDYQPVDIGDDRNADRLGAFSRRHGETALVVAVPRLVYGLYRDGAPADWGASDIALPSAGRWRDVFTGERFLDCERVRAADLFRRFPVAVLIGQAAP